MICLTIKLSNILNIFKGFMLLRIFYVKNSVNKSGRIIEYLNIYYGIFFHLRSYNSFFFVN